MRGYEPVLATSTDYCIGGFPSLTFPVYTRGIAFDYVLPNDIRWFSEGEKIQHKVLRRIPLHAIDRRAVNHIVRRFRSPILQFSQETSNLLASMHLDRDDVVFFPTANLVMALGIYDYVSKNAHNAAACWCFLFRQSPLRSPYERGSDLTPYAIRLLRTLFSQLSTSNMRMYFFTDSEQLAQDYDQLAPGLFRVAPIPHTAPKPAVPPAHDMLTVTYMGQARTGKGYHYLPRIVEELWTDYVEKNRMRFVIQSSVGWASSVSDLHVENALVHLQQFDSKRVKLVHDSISDAAYRKLLSSSDIVLMPYEPAGYFAQSSGICAEALTHGIPIVVPGGTWLARQFAREAYEYQDSFGKSSPLDERTVSDGGKSIELPCRGASHIRVKAVFGNNNTAPFFQTRVTQMGENTSVVAEDSAMLDRVSLPYATCLISLTESTTRLRVDIRHVAKRTKLDLQEAKATLLGENTKSPRSVVGMSYGSVGSIPDCLRNIAVNYAHYQDTARAFSDAYYKRHNADALIGSLTTEHQDQLT